MPWNRTMCKLRDPPDSPVVNRLEFPLLAGEGNGGFGRAGAEAEIRCQLTFGASDPKGTVALLLNSRNLTKRLSPESRGTSLNAADHGYNMEILIPLILPRLLPLLHKRSARYGAHARGGGQNHDRTTTDLAEVELVNTTLQVHRSEIVLRSQALAPRGGSVKASAPALRSDKEQERCPLISFP